MKNNKTVNTDQKAHRKKKRVWIPLGIILFLLISNTIATKIIYDNIFSGYHAEVRYDTSAYSDLLSSREANEFHYGKYTLQGYYYDNPDSSDLIVIAPGLHSGADDYISDIAYLYDNGFDVYSFDPTGTDSSEGKSCRGYTQEVFDLDYTLDYVEDTLTYDHLYLLGHSRGASAACAMLTYDHELDAVVSVSGFNSAMDAVIGLSSKYVGPVANINYPTLWAYQLTLFGYTPLQIHADTAMEESDIPVLVLQGENDTLASVEKHSTYSYLQSEACPANVTCELVKGYGHTDILYEEENGDPNTKTLDTITEFLRTSGS